MQRITRAMMVLVTAAALGLTPLLAGPAAAGPLDDAKAAGYVGERPDGYVGIAAGNAPAAVQQMAADINARRRAHYQGIATKNGTTLQAVQALAGQRLIDRSAPGTLVMSPAGSWTRK